VDSLAAEPIGAGIGDRGGPSATLAEEGKQKGLPHCSDNPSHQFPTRVRKKTKKAVVPSERPPRKSNKRRGGFSAKRFGGRRRQSELVLWPGFFFEMPQVLAIEKSALQVSLVVGRRPGHSFVGWTEALILGFLPMVCCKRAERGPLRLSGPDGRRFGVHKCLS